MAIEITVTRKVYLVPESSDPCELWRSYYSDLKKAVGTKNARKLWLITWSQNGAASCTTHGDFNKFLRHNHIDVSSAGTRAVADLSDIGGNILGLGKNFTKILSIGIPLVLVSVLVVVISLLHKASKKIDPGDIASLHPAGKVSIAAKLIKK